MNGLKILFVIGWLLILISFSLPAGSADSSGSDDHCTDIVVGKKASLDGSVITSHTGCGDDCRVYYVPAQTFSKGAMAPVFYGIQDVRRPLKDDGEVLGTIPQVEKTYAYFHSAYPHINEYQLAIAESTLSQKDELKTDITMGGK